MVPFGPLMTLACKSHLKTFFWPVWALLALEGLIFWMVLPTTILTGLVLPILGQLPKVPATEQKTKTLQTSKQDLWPKVEFWVGQIVSLGQWQNQQPSSHTNLKTVSKTPFPWHVFDLHAATTQHKELQSVLCPSKLFAILQGTTTHSVESVGQWLWNWGSSKLAYLSI